MYFLNNTQFSGASGPVEFAGADRTGIINILQFVGNKTRFVGQFSADTHRNASERMTLLEKTIHWMTTDGLPPSDGTPGLFHIVLLSRFLNSQDELLSPSSCFMFESC